MSSRKKGSKGKSTPLRQLFDAAMAEAQLDLLRPGSRDDAMNARTILHKGEQWFDNYMTNRSWNGMSAAETVRQLIPLIPREGEAVAIVDRGPSMTPNVAAKLKRFPGRVFVTDRALRPVFEGGGRPDAVINVDCSYLTLPFLLDDDLRDDAKRITAIFAATSHPLLVREWRGPKAFILTGAGGAMGRVMSQICDETRLPMLNAGGTVMTLAIGTAFWLGYREVVLIGCDNGYPKKMPPEHVGARVFQVTVAAKDGRKRRAWTDEVYWSYTGSLVEMSRQACIFDGLRLINCTDGGTVYAPHIEATTLDEYIDAKEKELVGGRTAASEEPPKDQVERQLERGGA